MDLAVIFLIIILIIILSLLIYYFSKHLENDPDSLDVFIFSPNEQSDELVIYEKNKNTAPTASIDSALRNFNITLVTFEEIPTNAICAYDLSSMKDISYLGGGAIKCGNCGAFQHADCFVTNGERCVVCGKN